MKREFYVFVSVLGVGIVGAGVLIVLQNSRVILAQNSVAIGASEINGVQSEYYHDFDAYVANKCEEQIKNETCSDLCRDLDEKIRVALEKESMTKEQLAMLAATPVPIVVPPKKKTVAPAGKTFYAGAWLTNDKKQISCNYNGGDHGKSSKKKKDHYDEDCCIDKDEWLQPGCTYLYSDLKYALNGKKPVPVYRPKKK